MHIQNCLTCQGMVFKSCKLLILIIILSLFIIGFPLSTGLVFSVDESQPKILESSVAPVADSATYAIERLLRGYGADEAQRTRVARAIAAAGREYDVDPRLVASIAIIESGANPYAISDRESVGVMQVHLPTWAGTVEHEELNLFNIEDNVDLGVRILKGYMVRYGTWEGVMRYKGWTDSPESHAGAAAYAEKVRHIYDPAYVSAAATEELSQ